MLHILNHLLISRCSSSATATSSCCMLVDQLALHIKNIEAKPSLPQGVHDEVDVLLAGTRARGDLQAHQFSEELLNICSSRIKAATTTFETKQSGSHDPQMKFQSKQADQTPLLTSHFLSVVPAMMWCWKGTMNTTRPSLVLGMIMPFLEDP